MRCVRNRIDKREKKRRSKKKNKNTEMKEENNMEAVISRAYKQFESHFDFKKLYFIKF